MHHNQASQSSPCLTDQQVNAFFQGTLEASAAESHLDSCADCRQLIGQVSKVYSPPQEKALGTSTIGRYTLLEELGSGGMGVVYAAYDEDLDRKVALKLLRGGASSDESTANERMLREARAMAKLSHPNVVGIYEVGTLDDALFLAMEHVENGTTLADWLSDKDTSSDEVIREIIDVFIGAGRGLSAAHAAGLVHRDFKPQNVLIDGNGCPQVTDFGLAQGSMVQEEQALPQESPAQASRLLQLTRTGDVVGTPAFMAPEQFKGRQTDARSDQFSFCVALYQALYGEAPFAGEVYGDLMTNVLTGNLRETPAGSKVPAWVRTLLLQGLATTPEDRFESMDLLLQKLATDPRTQRRRRIMKGGVGLIVLGLAGLAAFAFTQKTAALPCATAQSEMQSVWDDDVRQEVRQAFVATGRPYAEDTFARIDKQLTEYSDSWVAMHTQSCEATHVQGTQSDTLLDLRMQCLQERRGELAALTRAFTEATPSVVDEALKIANQLSALDRCADMDSLMTATPLPDDADIRSQVDTLYTTMNQARTLRDLGQATEALQLVRDVVDESAELEYPPLRAQALFLAGSLESTVGQAEAAEKTLRQAAKSAAEAKLDDYIAKSWIKLIYVIGHQQSKFDEALGISDYAEAAVMRAPSHQALQGDLVTDLATIHLDKANYKEAKRLLQEALSIARELYGDEHYDVAYISNSLAVVARREGNYEESLKHHQRTQKLWKALLGPRHPKVAISLMNMAPVLAILGNPDKAQAHLEEALEILESTHEGVETEVANCLVNLGVVHRRQGNHEEARKYLLRALAVNEEIAGEKPHPTVADTLYNLGNIELTLANYAQATRYYQRTLDIRMELFGEEHASIATAHYGLGDVLERQKKYAEALPHFEKSHAIWHASLGEKHPRVAFALVGLGKSQLGLGQSAEGIAKIEQAIALREAGKGNLNELSEMRFVLAKALWPTKKARAIALAKEVRDARATLGPGEKQGLAEVEEWLRDHR
jgi:tetratricopeptide (TPR) repeat protein